ncbi:hypothetical protein [Flavobacterium sp.]|uniref:hypothetical protein n=1 Tax=Flavobacterium sp. TaxID=239 RepID=UPI003D6B4BA5
MKNKMFLSLAAMVLTAGSVFAYANLTKSEAKKNCTEKCLPHCCDDDPGTCGPADCKK